MGRDRKQLCEVRENSGIPAREGSACGDRQKIPKGNPGRTHEEACLEKLSRSGRTEAIARGLADEH